jgi:hypothetical protein
VRRLRLGSEKTTAPPFSPCQNFDRILSVGATWVAFLSESTFPDCLSMLGVDERRGRSQVRVLSRPPLTHQSFRSNKRKNSLPIYPPGLSCLVNRRYVSCGHGHKSLPSFSTQSDSAQMVQVRSANQSTSPSKVSVADCLGQMHPRAGSRRSNVAAKARYGSGSFIFG